MGAVGAYKVDLLPSLSSECATKEIMNFGRLALPGRKVVWEVGSFKEFKKIYKERLQNKIFFRVEGREINHAIFWAKPGYIPQNAEEKKDMESHEIHIALFHRLISEKHIEKINYITKEKFLEVQALMVLSELEKARYVKII